MKTIPAIVILPFFLLMLVTPPASAQEQAFGMRGQVEIAGSISFCEHHARLKREYLRCDIDIHVRPPDSVLSDRRVRDGLIPASLSFPASQSSRRRRGTILP